MDKFHTDADTVWYNNGEPYVVEWSLGIAVVVIIHDAIVTWRRRGDIIFHWGKFDYESCGRDSRYIFKE